MATIERKRMSSINAESRSNFKKQNRNKSCHLKMGRPQSKYQTVVPNQSNDNLQQKTQEELELE